MKKQLRIAARILLVIILISAVAATIALTPAVWKPKMTAYLNRLLVDAPGWQVEFGRVSGHLLTTSQISDIRITKTDSALFVHIPSARLSINPFPWLFRHYGFRKVILDSVWVYARPRATGSVFPGDSLRLDFVRRFNLSINHLFISGTIIRAADPEDRTYEMEFTGMVKPYSEGVFVGVREFALSRTGTPPTLYAGQSDIMITPTHLYLALSAGSWNAQDFRGNLKFDFTPRLTMAGDLRLLGVQPPDPLYQNLSLRESWRDLDIGIEFETDFTGYSGDYTVLASTDTASGSFDLSTSSGVITFNSFTLELDSSRLEGQGVINPGGRSGWRLRLTDLDLQKLVSTPARTRISGLLLVEVDYPGSRLTGIILTAELTEEQVLKDRRITVSGTLDYHDRQLEITNPVVIADGRGAVTLKGNYHTAERRLELSLGMKNAAVALLDQFLPEPFSGGTIDGSMRISGVLPRVTVETELQGTRLAYRGAELEQVSAKANFWGNWDRHNGSITMNIGRGRWGPYHFNEGTADISVHDRVVSLSSIYVNEGRNFLQLSGESDLATYLHIDRVQIAYQLHYLVSTKPVDLVWGKERLEIKPFFLHIDDGTASGFLRLAEDREGRLKFSNFDAHVVTQFMPQERYRFQGRLFGEISFSGPRDDEVIQIEMSMKKGRMLKQAFDDMVLSGVIHKDLLHLDEFTLTQGEKVGIQMNGVIPLTRATEEEYNIFLTSRLRSVDLTLLRQFLPRFPYLDGQVTGRFDLGGTTAASRFSYDLSIANAVYDRIPLGQIRGRGKYQDKRFDLTHFESLHRRNQVSGSGRLPVDFDLSSDTFGKWIYGDTLALDVRARTGDLEFLTVYFPEVDSITGRIDMALELSGTPEKIIRDGWLKIDRGTVYTILLNNNITDIFGDLALIENRFIINRLVGTLVPPAGSERLLDLRTALARDRTSRKPNLSLQGSLDMTRFFEPRFDIAITGNNVYVKTLLGNIEGTANADLKMTGKDTITYAGEITPLKVVMKQEFVAVSVDESTYERGRVIPEYKITFPISGDFTLQNSQLDADLTGVLSLTQLGNFEADYSGELIVRSGKFYYYGDVFRIREGSSLVFDGQGFNPSLDIQASTYIDTFEIVIDLNGKLADPALVFRCDNDPTLDESDILELLTFRKRIEDPKFASQGFGKLPQTLLGTWFEQQLEKNFLQVTGLDKLGLVDEVDISGTSGLLNTENPEDLTISAMRHVSDKLLLNYSYRRSFSLTNPNMQQVGVEYKLNRYFSLVGSYDEAGNLQVKYRLRYSY